jgi:Uma2 family endonuclease
MGTNTAHLLSHDDAPHEDHAVRFAATWLDYQRHLRIRGEASRPRLTFGDGVLEVMNPSRSHESIKNAIGCLVEVYLEVNNLPYTGVGSWTLSDEQLEKGLEPDECYLLGPDDDRDVPDLAIEVVWTAGGRDKLPIYLALGVREVWVWRRGKIAVHLLRGKRYQPSQRSSVLAGIDLDELAACVDVPRTSEATKRFRSYCRKQKRRAAK